MENSEKLVLSVEEAAQLLGVCKVHLYKLIREGQIPILKLGRRIVVPRCALLKMLESVTAGSKS